ncbi:MAG: DUF3318 domain-containing protein [Elainellaceae cyanobacterium]|jgi:hypothetical protein|nr:DUF3318 domain-containing protein [Leptolyngbya sp. CCY15150]
MLNPDPEIRRLLDLMPASGRMVTKLVSRPEQSAVVDVTFPLPWHRTRPINVNFDLWGQLSRPQRDLMLLRTVAWLTSIRWFQPSIYQGLVLAGAVGTLIELSQGDAIGAVTAGGLTALAGTQIWRGSRSPQLELEADEAALRVAQRRGYTEPEAARHLVDAIEVVAAIERRPGLDFTELLRCQNLRAIAGSSSMGVPDPMRRSLNR